MNECAVPNCPALCRVRSPTCDIHRHARTAGALKIARDKDGIGGERCVRCRRAFRKEDWVEKDLLPTTKRRDATFGHAHANCDPAPVRRLVGRKLRESVKPLLAGIDG